MDHKRQHYVPSSYLEAWVDPSTPADQTPYVWLFSKDGRKIKNKAPKKIFYQKNMYSIYAPDGSRDLHLETNLSRIESKFATLREGKLKERQFLNSKECLEMCMFVAALYARTPGFGEKQSSIWQNVLDMGEKTQAAIDTASPEKQKQMIRALASPSANNDNSMTMEDVQELVDNPIQSFLSANVTQLSPLLFGRPFLILETTDDNIFITSDDPCVWHDPAAYQDPRPFGAGGLVSPTLEITIPISPNQLLFFCAELRISGKYEPIEPTLVDALNLRTRLGSHEYIVSNSSVKRESWFSH